MTLPAAYIQHNLFLAFKLPAWHGHKPCCIFTCQLLLEDSHSGFQYRQSVSYWLALYFRRKQILHKFLCDVLLLCVFINSYDTFRYIKPIQCIRWKTHLTHKRIRGHHIRHACNLTGGDAVRMVDNGRASSVAEHILLENLCRRSHIHLGRPVLVEYLRPRICRNLNFYLQQICQLLLVNLAVLINNLILIHLK